MCIFDVPVVDIDSSYYDGRHQHKTLSHHDQLIKLKYLDACFDRQGRAGVMGK